jgi:hypothetical protein
MIDFTSQLPDFLGEPGDVREWMEVALLETADPVIDPCLSINPLHAFTSLP